ncbi:MAG: helix-turn-helix domain-containing protein, partial [Muribaculaceae bacterium]|nr:helix-turn-helix domain-containing protein [Muribaculaceae bacterium]
IDQCMEDIRGRKHFHFFFLEKDVNELQILFLPQDATREQQLEFIHDTFSKGWSIRNIAAHTGISKSTIHRLLATTREQLLNTQEEKEEPQVEREEREEQKEQELHKEGENKEEREEEEEKEEVSNRTKKTKKENDKKKKNKKHKKCRKN